MMLEEVMTGDVVTLGPEQTLAEAAAVFIENSISGAPVVDGDSRVLGMLTESDILKALESKYTEKRLVLPSISAKMPVLGLRFENIPTTKEAREAFEEIRSLTVSDVMSTPVITMAPSDAVEDAARTMLEKKINRIPVVTADRVVGIVTRGNLLRAISAPGG